MSLDVTFWAVREHATTTDAPRELHLGNFAPSQGRAYLQFGFLYDGVRLHLGEEPRASSDLFFSSLVWERAERLAPLIEGHLLRRLSAVDVAELATLAGHIWAQHYRGLAAAIDQTIAADCHCWFTKQTAVEFVQALRTLVLDAANHGAGLLIVTGAGFC